MMRYNAKVLCSQHSTIFTQAYRTERQYLFSDSFTSDRSFWVNKFRDPVSMMFSEYNRDFGQSDCTSIFN